MNPRATAAGLALLLLSPAAAACDPQSTAANSSATSASTQGAEPAAAAVATSASADPAPQGSAAYGCSGIYNDSDDTGVTLANGKVTGTMTLSCDNVPAAGAFFLTTVSLFYRPNDHDATTDLAPADYNSYQDAYATPADTCRVGEWYVGWSGDAGYGHGPELDITSCAETID